MRDAIFKVFQHKAIMWMRLGYINSVLEARFRY